MVWMVAILFLISNSSSSFSSPCEPFQVLLLSLCSIAFSSKVQVFDYLFAFFHFYSVVCWNSKIYKMTSFYQFFFLLINNRSVLLIRIGRSVCISKSQRILLALFSQTNPGLWIYHLSVCSRCNPWHNSQRITFSTRSFIVLYSFCVYLLYLLIMQSTASSLSPCHLHLLICCVLSVFPLIYE